MKLTKLEQQSVQRALFFLRPVLPFPLLMHLGTTIFGPVPQRPRQSLDTSTNIYPVPYTYSLVAWADMEHSHGVVDEVNLASASKQRFFIV